MRIAVYSGYGNADVVRICDAPEPVPNEDEALISVRAASIEAPDWRLMHGKPAIVRLFFGMRKPKFRPGRNVSGEVVAVGSRVTGFKHGDAVLGMCPGAFAEYVCARESRLVKKPETLTYEEAAALPISALTALQGLRDYGKVRPGQRVLINGSSGGVGTFAVQIAKNLGATVTGVCSTGNVELARSLGADRVIDYTQQDFTQTEDRYDVIYDLVGDRPLAQLGAILTADGRYVAAGAPKNVTLFGLLARLVAMTVRSRLGSRKYVSFIARSNQGDLGFLAGLAGEGKLKPAIDRCYTLDETAAALGYVDQGHARAKVVIVING
ncbi:MAG TPA: NAD(P)-dependent alcohol dehydrogenase [Candidatus Rubrimentiphilum sp.]|nr:NAD(P)-dependent alcohol dehydrogenase [Candidatus Rubrimentiphilum sp.]